MCKRLSSASVDATDAYHSKSEAQAIKLLRYQLALSIEQGVCRMNRPILRWHRGVIAFFGLIAFAAEPGLPWEHVQDSNALAGCWEDLAAVDAEVAYRAAGRLVQNPEAAVKLLRKSLRASEAPDMAKIQAWVDDLSSAKFSVRNSASNALVGQGELAEVTLRKSLETKIDFETRRRVQTILSRLDEPVVAPEKLREIRAVEVLETLSSAEAKDLLQLLAKGYSEHRQTRQATESLRRLNDREPLPERWIAWAKSQLPVADKDDPLPFGARVRFGTTRFRHQSQGGPTGRNSGGFSADSRLVISHDQDAVYVWETQTGKLQRKFPLAAACFAVAPKDPLLALGLTDRGQKNGAVVLLNWQTGKELRRLELPAGTTPIQLAFSPDGGKVLCQNSDDKLSAWDIISGRETSLWQPTDKPLKLYGFSLDGAAVVVGAETNYVVDLKKNQKQVLPAKYRLYQVAFSPDASLVAITAESGSQRIHICDAASGKLRWRSGDGIGGFRTSPRFSPNGKLIAAGGYQQEISVWDVQTGKFLRSLPGSNDAGVGAISADGRWLASTGQTLGVWNLETGQRVSVGAGHSMIANGLALSKRCDWIATNDYGEVRLWDPTTGKPKGTLDTGTTFMRSAAVSPDGKLIAAGQPGPGDGFVKVWEAATGRLIYKLPGHGVRDYGRDAEVHFSPDGRYLVSWGDDGFLRKWDVKTGKARSEFLTRAPGTGDRRDFIFRAEAHGWNSQFDRFFLLERGGDLHSFDVHTGKESAVVKLRPTQFSDEVAFSATARLVAIGGRFDVTIQDTATGKSAFTVTLTGRPRRLAFSPDERTLAAAVDDKIVVVEIATGKVRLTFPANAHALTFSADGRFLAASMADTSALLWDLAILADRPKK
jgi:WD40 repeat protein